MKLKMKPVFCVLTALLFLTVPFTVFAAGPTPKIDSGDTTWMLIATAIVIFMHVPGLALFYGGLVNERNVVSTMMHSFVSLLVITIVWVLWGYSLSFGPDFHGFIGGLDYFGFNHVDSGPALGTLTIPHYIFAIFQCAFAAITVAIISGGIAGRIAFPAWALFSGLWVTFIYAPMAHWVWGGGWLFSIGELDFAGGTVVHILSGVSALIAAIVIGPRFEYLKKGQTPHNIVLFLIGASSLWFGWFGFNSGSALTSNGLTALSFANTQIAAAAGGLGWLFIEWKMKKHPTLVGTATGAIAGLVGITPGAGFVTVLSAIIIGFLSAPVCYFGIHFVKARLKYDDTLDAFGVHGLGGIWGALATGLFATKSVNSAGNNGLFYGNPAQLLHQTVGVVTAILLATVGTYLVLKAVGLFTPLRVSKEEEMMGLDLSFHEEPAYNSIRFSKSTNQPAQKIYDKI